MAKTAQTFKQDESFQVSGPLIQIAIQISTIHSHQWLELLTISWQHEQAGQLHPNNCQNW